MGHRGEPNLGIISIRISRLHDGFTGGPRPFLGNWRRTAHRTHFGSGTTVRGALSKSRSTHQRRAIRCRILESHGNEATHIPLSSIPTRQTIRSRLSRRNTRILGIRTHDEDYHGPLHGRRIFSATLRRDQRIQPNYKTPSCVWRICTNHHRSFIKWRTSYGTETTRRLIFHSFKISFSSIRHYRRCQKDVSTIFCVSRGSRNSNKFYGPTLMEKLTPINLTQWHSGCQRPLI